MKSLLKNSLFHFILIGTVLYVCYTAMIPDNKDTIDVNKQTVDAIIKADEEISQTELSEERKKVLIENYIDEEVLLRESYRLDLHKSDYRVRKRLLSIMRSSITEIIPEPSLAQLRAYYDQNQQKFKNEEALTFETVRFPFNSENIPDDSEKFIEKLESSQRPIDYSEITLYGNKTIAYSYQQIAMTYGKEMADISFESEIKKWKGPISSRSEIVYFRIIEKHEPFVPKFESIESYLRDEYYLTKSRELQQAKIDNLRKKYIINIEGS